VCDEEYRGKSLGKWYLELLLFCFYFILFLPGSLTHSLASVIEQLKSIAKAQGCYKVILDCDEKNQGFYEKLGFKKKEVQMAYYFE
jgi:GNAT superfamily N-acetyltransferase